MCSVGVEAVGGRNVGVEAVEVGAFGLVMSALDQGSTIEPAATLPSTIAVTSEQQSIITDQIVTALLDQTSLVEVNDAALNLRGTTDTALSEQWPSNGCETASVVLPSIAAHWLETSKSMGKMRWRDNDSGRRCCW